MNARLIQLFRSLRREDQGVLTFEWVLLITLVVIGIVSGLSSVRDAIIDELSDIAEAAINFDQSYTIAEFSECGITAPGFEFEDELPVFERCVRSSFNPGQDPPGP